MYKKLLRPLLFRLEPETAHYLTAMAGQSFCSLPFLEKPLTQRYDNHWPLLHRNIAGLDFKNPVGIAAGFDKNGSSLHLLRFLGFGYAELGSITAQASSGNIKPRVFRLPEDAALINRMGLNNNGAATICRRLQDLKEKKSFLFDSFPCGINIAKTHNPDIFGDDAIEDYLLSFREAQKTADFITLNVSCPNTAEGKTFEEAGPLSELLDALRAEREKKKLPLFVKFSPDVSLDKLETLVDLCEERKIDGYVVGNTSSQRKGLFAEQEKISHLGKGGLSGAPLYTKSLKRVKRLRKWIPQERVILGCGGIDHPEKAIQMLKSGADLLQIYTGLVYEGPGLIQRINQAIVSEIQKEGARSLEDWLLRPSE